MVIRALMCHGCRFSWQSPLRGWGSLTMAFIGKFVYMTHHFILLRLNPFGLRVDREGWWFEHSCVTGFAICLKDVSWPWLSPLWGWGSLTMAFTGVVWLWHLLAFTMAFTNLKIKNHNYQVHMTWCTWYLNQQEFVHRGYSVFNRICQYLKVRHCPWAGNSCLKRHIFSE